MNRELSRLNKMLKRQEEIYHQCAKRAGITDTKFWVLYSLCESGGVLCQKAFCENWCYSKQTVNTAVSGLEKDGFIYLIFAEGSKKQKEIRLTDKGEDFCDKHIRNVLEAECRSLMKLSEEERANFFDLIKRILSDLEGEL